MSFDDPERSSGPAWTQHIDLDTYTMSPMLDFQNRQVDKQLILLDSQRDSTVFPRLTLGTQLRASGFVAQTNTTDKFGYLGRFPPDFLGTSASDFRLVHANLAGIVRASPWVVGYVETLFSDVFTFPTFNQGSFQTRQAYVVVGNLDEFPVYGFIGKKNVSFGDMRSLSPFSQAMPWHYFAPLGEGAGLGYSRDGVDLTFTALNGGRGIRVSDSESRGEINNFAANGSYTYDFSDDASIQFGGGYLHGTIYDGSVAEHILPLITGPRNGAWDVNGSLRLGDFTFAGEYVETENNWPVVRHIVQAFKVEGSWRVPFISTPTRFTTSWGQGLQGGDNDSFRHNTQLVLGSEVRFNENVRLSFEYVRSMGFAPLINITAVSNPDTVQNTFLMGLVVVL